MKITTPAELRAVLMLSIEGVLEQRVSVPQGNCVWNLAQQVHRSQELEFDMRCYVAEHFKLNGGDLIKLLENKEEDGSEEDS